MGLFIAILVIFIVIAVIANHAHEQKKKGLIDGGRIIERKSSFIQQAQIYTTKATMDEFLAAFEKMDFSGLGLSWEGSRAKGIRIKSSNLNFEAQLLALPPVAQGNVYQFNFLRWTTYNGAPLNIDEMNILLTGVEKAFLSVDPGTQVDVRPLKAKSGII